MAYQRDTSFVPRIQNLLINVPPGCGKSRLVSVCAPAWMWTRWPSWKVICLSSNPRVSIRDSMYCRDLIRSRWYQDTFEPSWKFATDADGKILFKNTAGGFRQALGFDSRITGDRGDCLLNDDPHDADEVLSEIKREHVCERWEGAIHNRVNDLRSSTRIGVMQRLHDKDWSGHVLEKGGWEHLCIPQEFEAERARTTAIGWRDPRTADGELMFPERFPAHVVEAEKKRLGPYGYAGQHQQRPVPREGAMFQSQWFEVVDATPAQAKRVRYWDKAGAKPGKGDWTVGVLMAKTPDGLYWIEDVVRGQWPADERNKVIRQTAEMDRQTYGSVRIYVEQPPGLAKEATDAVVKLLAGFNVAGDPVHRDKEERAEPLAAQCRAGNVRMKRDTAWNKPFLDVVTVFPFGNHDDDVDAASGAFNKLSSKGEWGIV